MRRNIFLIVIGLLIAGILVFKLLKKSDGGIAGIDSTGSGIRDDVRTMIEKKYTDPRIKSAALQLAKTYQNEITHPDTADDLPGAFAVDCLVYVAGMQADDIQKEIQALSANTAERIKALIHFSARFSGKILHGAKSPEEACSFDPSLLEKK